MTKSINDARLDEIKHRWSNDGGMGNERSDEDYTDAGCRILARFAFADVPYLVDRVEKAEAEIAATKHVNSLRCVHQQGHCEAIQEQLREAQQRIEAAIRAIWPAVERVLAGKTFAEREPVEAWFRAALNGEVDA